MKVRNREAKECSKKGKEKMCELYCTSRVAKTQPEMNFIHGTESRLMGQETDIVTASLHLAPGIYFIRYLKSENRDADDIHRSRAIRHSRKTRIRFSPAITNVIIKKKPLWFYCMCLRLWICRWVRLWIVTA